ncbi:MAG: hypothetical protein Q7S52_03590 [bacterium]|nr:hypothetical protein [bacterium]
MALVLENEIKSLIRKTMKETLRAELANLRATILPLVSKEEMADIIKWHKKPTILLRENSVDEPLRNAYI